jgi:hypothetical protein
VELVVLPRVMQRERVGGLRTCGYVREDETVTAL